MKGFEDPKEANVLIFTPILDNKYLPEKVRKFLRFGVPEYHLAEEKTGHATDSDDEIKINSNNSTTKLVHNGISKVYSETTINYKYSPIEDHDMAETII